MRTSIPIVICLAAVMSCESVDPSVEQPASMSISFDLRSEAAKAGIVECRSVAKRVELLVPDSTYSLAADPLRGQVRFDEVTVEPGIVPFAAQVWNADTTVVLFSGETTADIATPRFEDVHVQLETLPDVPVMQLCLEDGALAFDLENRGQGVLKWHVEPIDSPECQEDYGRACILFIPEEGELPTGSVQTVILDIKAPSSASTDTTSVVSAEGEIEIILAPDPASEARSKISL